MTKDDSRDHAAQAVLYYVHDPMCAWCWAFDNALKHLTSQLPKRVELRRLLGGLAPDTDTLMDGAMRDYLQSTWQRIEERVPGTGFNFNYWRLNTPRRQTWPACRAVIAARTLDPLTETKMVAAIQRAYYEQARDPSSPGVLSELAVELGLERERFESVFESTDTQCRLEDEMAQARAMGVNGFPSVRLALSDGSIWPISVNYLDANAMRRAIDRLLTPRST